MVVIRALLCVASAATLVSGAGLVDNPIVGDEPAKYLDGDWTASMKTGTCQFKVNTDFDHGTDGPHVAVQSQDECCKSCWMNDDCAAAVLSGGQCWLKSASQLEKPSTQTGTVACVRDKAAGGLTIPAKVPGDLISDLYAAGQIGNPLFELNWLNSSIWNDNVWTYKKTFEADSSTILVFDGVKMGAIIKVNGKAIGNTTDQFRRYAFPLKDVALRPQDNVLEVEFVGRALACQGRWMACTGGWDWAPYTNTFQEGAQTFTKGIWKSVYTVKIQKIAAIEHFVPHVFYQGGHPTSPLEDGDHAGFEVHARVHLSSPTAIKGVVTVSGSWDASGQFENSSTQEVDLPAGESNVTLVLGAAAKDIKLWWPAGYGAQNMYEVFATFSVSGISIQTNRKIGFRTVALVTGNDTDPGYVKAASQQEGTDSHGMLFRVNGAAIMSKGANMIPMEEMEGWMDADAHWLLVKSAREGRMNTLRNWGGGMFLPDAWYDACDEYGILIYHDMMYAQQGHSPHGSREEDAELRHIVRRLSHHPSIMVWDGCNECRVKMGTPTGIYATFVMTVVAQEDASRPVWPSCPAIGWTTGVHKLNSLPNGNTLTTPNDGRSIETHGYYQHGTGFPAVNGASNLQMFDANIPLNLKQGSTGLGFENVFASEFGGSVYSSFESMSPTLAKEHWAIHAGQPADTCSGGFGRRCTGGNVMAQRNYPCDNYIYVYFGKTGQEFNISGEFNFKKQLYQCMIGHDIWVKQDIEGRMSQNTFGIIIWQYNEIWPTGGWGSIEYGNPNFPGQVVGGRWKPLQYWYAKSIFADVTASCGKDGACYVRNDKPIPYRGTLKLTTVAFADASEKELLSLDLSLAAGAGTLKWFHSDEVAALNGTTHILEAVITNPDGTVMAHNTIPFATPEQMALKKSNVAVTSDSVNGEIVAHVTTDAVAAYVTLTTLAHGHFEDNAFLLKPPGRTVKFLPASPSPHNSFVDCYRAFQDSIRVEDVSTYAPPLDAMELLV